MLDLCRRVGRLVGVETQGTICLMRGSDLRNGLHSVGLPGGTNGGHAEGRLSMALKPCPECGHKVARSAKVCPNCGHDLRGFWDGMRESGYDPTGCSCLLIVVITVLVFAGLIWLLNSLGIELPWD